MRDDNNDDGDEGDDEDDDGAYRYSGYGGCSESESEWADDRDGWSDRWFALIAIFSDLFVGNPFVWDII